MDKYEEYLNLLPTVPPAEIYKWIEEQKIIKVNDYLVYRPDSVINPLTGDKEKIMRCHCTACDTDFTAAVEHSSLTGCHAGYTTSSPRRVGWHNNYTGKGVYDWEHTKCPECHAEVHAYGSHNMRNGRYIAGSSIMTIENKNNCLVLVEWNISVYTDKYGKREYQPYIKNGYIADGKWLIRAIGRSHGEWCKYKSINKTWAILSRYDDMTGNMAGHIYPFSENVLKGTCAENSKLDLYIKSGAESIYPVSYLKLYLNHKNAENLIMQGMSDYVSELIAEATEENCNNTYTCAHSGKTSVNIQSVDWKEKKPYKMLGLNSKPEFLSVCANGISPSIVECYKNHKNKIKFEELVFLQKYCSKDGIISKVVKGEAMTELLTTERNPIKAIKYLLKQNARKKLIEHDVRYLLDYWGMARDLKYNLRDTAIKYPRSLKKAHDNAVSAHTAKENAELDLKITERYEQLKKYCYKSDGLEIHPAKSSAEFIKEGAELSHCVSTYTKRHANGGTAIFFIRHSDAPDVPYFTLELNERTLTVMQNRGKRNCARTEEVVAFEAEWLEHIRKVNKEEKSNGKRNSKTAA